MKRQFLEEMGLTKEQVDKILDENSQISARQKVKLPKFKQTSTQQKKKLKI